jgi:hypothetical protein
LIREAREDDGSWPSQVFFLFFFTAHIICDAFAKASKKYFWHHYLM